METSRGHVELLKGFLSTNFTVDPHLPTASTTKNSSRRNLSKQKLNKFLIYDDSEHEPSSEEAEDRSVLYNLACVDKSKERGECWKVRCDKV